MAQEIRIKEAVLVANGNFRDEYDPGVQYITQAAVGGGNPGVVSVTTSEADISFGSITANLVVMKNLDATNFVQIGPKSSGAMVPMIKLRAGESARIMLESGVTLRAIANTATCKVLIKGYVA